MASELQKIHRQVKESEKNLINHISEKSKNDRIKLPSIDIGSNALLSSMKNKGKIMQRLLHSELPSHVKNIYYGQSTVRCPFLQPLTAHGINSMIPLNKEMEMRFALMPWETAEKESSVAESLGGYNPSRNRMLRPKQVDNSSIKQPDRYSVEECFRKLELKSPLKKIQFFNVRHILDLSFNNMKGHLKRVRQCIRFWLPVCLEELNGMSPLQFIEKYTILEEGLRRRYERIFKKYRERDRETLEYFLFPKNFYDALHQVTHSHLSQENCANVRVAFLMLPDQRVCLKQFYGIAAFTERLQFTANCFGPDEDTFHTFEIPNREELEYLDFEFIERRLEYYKDVTHELSVILRSLA